MKLNYTSLQHTVRPVEGERAESAAAPAGGGARAARPARPGRVGVRAGGARRAPGYVQTEGGALPGGHSRTVRALRERGLLAGHITAGAAFGGEGEAITTAGALHHGAARARLGRRGVRAGAGDRGLAARRSATAACRRWTAPTRRSRSAVQTLLVARMSSGDPRARHRGISHHTLTVLDLLLAPVTVALPAGMRSPVGAELRGWRWGRCSAGPSAQPAGAGLDVERPGAA